MNQQLIPRHSRAIACNAPTLLLGLLVLTHVCLTMGIASGAEKAMPIILLTSDGEGHLGPCESCPAGVGQGGLARRATIVARARAKDPLLLVDAGNWLVGAQSTGSRGEVVAVAYEAIGYDVVHITPKDLYWGKAQTLALVSKAKFAAVSATLLDSETGRPLFQPYVVKEVGGQKVAVLGVSEIPPGLESMPLLRSQLAGVRIMPAADAIDEWLPKAKKDSDHLVLLYQGNGKGLRALRMKLAGSGVIICVSGIRPENTPEGEPLVVTAEMHGKSIARTGMTEGKLALTQIAVTPDVPPDSGMSELLNRYVQREVIATIPTPASSNPPVASGTPAVPTTAPGMASPIASAPPTPPVAVVPVVPMPTLPVPVASTAPSPATEPAGPELRRVAAHSDRAPKGLEGVGVTADQVNGAIEHGRDFLWANLKAQLVAEHRKMGDDSGQDMLQALALVHAGAHLKYREFDSELRGMLTRLDPTSDRVGTYQMGIACMLIGDYAEPMFLPKMRLLTRRLVEEQCPEGSWDYARGVPASIFGDQAAGPALSVEGGMALDQTPGAPPVSRLSPFGKRDPGDTSTSQFALLGLRAASRVRIMAAPEVWTRSLQSVRARRCKDGGWGYDYRPASAYGSMTCAGICCLAIDRFELGEQDPVVDPDIERALGWLDSHFSVSVNPEYGSYLYYYLYSLERVGRILDTEFIGTHEWYPEGAKFLIEAQKKDGSWLEKADTDPRIPTSFALLFLTRATQSLKVEVKHGGQGQISTAVATPPPARLYVILDASGSMLEEMDGRQKFDIARDSVSGMFAGMPESSEVALRVYGHRLRSNQPGSDEDTNLEYPMAKIDRPMLAELLKKLRPRGKTPLALSLSQAKQDLSSFSGQPVTVVLLTDGGEDTRPRRDPVKAAAEFAQLSGITFHIVGFDINQEDWSTQLHEMSEQSKARYWPAARAGALVHNLRAAVFGIPDDFTLFDADSKQVATGEFGTSKTLPEGKYRLTTAYAGQQFNADLWVNTGAATGVVFDASRVGRSPTTAPAPAPAVTAARKFCTHCGAPLKPGAKFCSNCGTKVE
jgi:hypothetical protein